MTSSVSWSGRQPDSTSTNGQITMPVLQGWERDDYLRCWDMYNAAGVDLSSYPVVGLGSVCRRQATGEIGNVVSALTAVDPGLPLHGFGVKKRGLELYGHLLNTADSMAWSFDARRSAPLEGCVGHINCANCPRYALTWRRQVLTVMKFLTSVDRPSLSPANAVGGWPQDTPQRCPHASARCRTPSDPGRSGDALHAIAVMRWL